MEQAQAHTGAQEQSSQRLGQRGCLSIKWVSPGWTYSTHTSPCGEGLGEEGAQILFTLPPRSHNSPRVGAASGSQESGALNTPALQRGQRGEF